MKELLKFSKYLEIDFVNADASYQSKMDLAISSLVTGDYSKAKQLFDGAIEIDSQFPSAWLGKAFAEIALVDDDGFNSLAIDEYLTRAMRTTDDILKYKVAIAGCLAYRHAVIIKKCVLAVEEALAQQAKAKKERNIAIATAVAGTMFTGKDKSIGSNIVGGALIAGGANHAIKTHLKAQEMEVLGKSIYTAALAQTYLSIPIIHLCGSLETQIKDDLLRANFNVVLDSWKDSVNYLYKKQRDQLVKLLRAIKINEAESIQKLLKNPNSIQEVGELKAFLVILGMGNHSGISILESVFNESLSKYFNGKDVQEKLQSAKRKQQLAPLIAVPFAFLAIFLIGLFPKNNFMAFISFLVDLTGIIIGMKFAEKAKPTEMKEFVKIWNDSIYSFSVSILKNEDFNFSLIEKNPTSNNSHSLGS
jgi:hypothetical protein